MDWFNGLQKNLTAAATEAAERAQQLAAQASVQAKAYGDYASVQAKAYAEQATEKAKVLAALATDEAQVRLAQLKQAAAATGASSSSSAPQAADLDPRYYGVTDGLIEYVSNMTYSTFSDSPASTATPGASFRLSSWQEKHAMLLLERVEQLQHLRYALCPKRMDEQQFWTVYFAEVKALLPPQAFGLPEAPAPAPLPGASSSPAGTQGAASGGAGSAGEEPAGGGRAEVAAQSRLASGASAVGTAPADPLEATTAGDSSDEVEDGEQLDELEDDPELAAYLQEALALDDEQGELGSADLGSVADDDLDDYINQLQDEEVHSKLSTPAKVPEA